MRRWRRHRTGAHFALGSRVAFVDQSVGMSTEANDASPVTPLNVLLSHALLDLTRACERAGAEEVVLRANLLRMIGDDGVNRNALP